MAKAKVLILMGSDSDWPVMKHAAEVLGQFGVGYEAHVSSAHRTPARTAKFVRGARDEGFSAIICGAGAAAHLAGVCAAETTLPVLGVPLDATSLHGLDALLATVQMPAGVPVATFAVGEAGARNAALFAVQILGTARKAVAAKLARYKAEMADKVEKKDQKLQEML
ncbi:MAG: 5-(carboxyamino)imidazole ribonucleotide mutase [Candidatus Lernaella stagnicola]|nr:5-(carboxyamino)imidazole ribonucleotide mutase [Candidatus Lernaella stagnicola]